MSTFKHRLATTKAGLTPRYASQSDEWFAWFPVRLGALGTGRLVWLRRVWRNRCMGCAIYQNLAWVRSLEAPSASGSIITEQP